MKIDINSWHYRWFARDWENKSKSLCSYFWKVVFHFIGRSIWWTGAGFIGAFAFGFGTYIFTWPFWGWFLTPPPLEIMIISITMWVMILLVTVSVITDYFMLKYNWTRPHSVKEKKEPGLVMSYIRAKHRKVCPLIEYVDVELEEIK